MGSQLQYFTYSMIFLEHENEKVTLIPPARRFGPRDIVRQIERVGAGKVSCSWRLEVLDWKEVVSECVVSCGECVCVVNEW